MIKKIHGANSSIGRALVCDASGYEFEPHLAPYIPKNMKGINKKYTLVRIDQLRVNDKLKAELVYGRLIMTQISEIYYQE